MSHHASRPFLSLPAVFLLLAGCENPDARKLTGRYSLESAASAQWTNGATLTPPAITGVLLLNQSRFGQDGAYGSAKMELTLSSGPMGGQSVNWNGSYSNHAGGEMRMRLMEVRFEGEHIVDDDLLTITLSAEYSGPGPSPVGTLVWKREPES
ncbi:MAG: hypothetical protein OXQ93_00395 [Gemmatimonadota bacterium]|nr:hypothetical protein [Gemmatimonadota bacterium]